MADINLTEWFNKFSALHQRQDSDMNLYYLEKYQLMDKDDRPLKNVSNITLNDPHVFGDAFMSIMQSDNRTIDITGVDPSLQSKLEKVLSEWLLLNDDSLAEQMIEPFDFCIDFFNTFRGWSAVLPLVYNDGSKYMPTVLPLDPRWMCWEVSRKGLKWAAYSMRINKDDAESMFNKSLSTREKTVILDFVWDSSNYMAFHRKANDRPDRDLLDSIEHKLGHCPIIITPVPTQPMIIAGGNDSVVSTDQAALKYQGESIYAPIRELVESMNEVASVWATINRMQFEAPIVYIGDRSWDHTKRPYGYAMVIELKEGEQLVKFPLPEMSASSQNLFAQLFSRWERATLSSVNYGQALGERQSALAIADLKSDRDKIVVPRRKAKSKMYRYIFNEWRRQINNGGYKTGIDDDDNWVEIDKSMLEKKFQVQVNFDSVTPQENIVNTQIALEWLQMGIDITTVLREVMKHPDPEGTTRRAKAARLHQLLPALELVDAGLELCDDDSTQKKMNERKAVIIAQALDKLIAQQTAELGEVKNPGSPPNLNNTMNKPSSEKLSQMQVQRMTAAGKTAGSRAKNLEVEQ